MTRTRQSHEINLEIGQSTEPILSSFKIHDKEIIELINKINKHLHGHPQENLKGIYHELEFTIAEGYLKNPFAKREDKETEMLASSIPTEIKVKFTIFLTLWDHLKGADNATFHNENELDAHFYWLKTNILPKTIRSSCILINHTKEIDMLEKQITERKKDFFLFIIDLYHQLAKKRFLLQQLLVKETSPAEILSQANRISINIFNPDCREINELIRELQDHHQELATISSAINQIDQHAALIRKKNIDEINDRHTTIEKQRMHLAKWIDDSLPPLETRINDLNNRKKDLISTSKQLTHDINLHKIFLKKVTANNIIVTSDELLEKHQQLTNRIKIFIEQNTSLTTAIDHHNQEVAHLAKKFNLSLMQINIEIQPCKILLESLEQFKKPNEYNRLDGEYRIIQLLEKQIKNKISVAAQELLTQENNLPSLENIETALTILERLAPKIKDKDQHTASQIENENKIIDLNFLHNEVAVICNKQYNKSFYSIYSVIDFFYGAQERWKALATTLQASLKNIQEALQDYVRSLPGGVGLSRISRLKRTYKEMGSVNQKKYNEANWLLQEKSDTAKEIEWSANQLYKKHSFTIPNDAALFITIESLEGINSTLLDKINMFKALEITKYAFKLEPLGEISEDNAYKKIINTELNERKKTADIKTSTSMFNKQLQFYTHFKSEYNKVAATLSATQMYETNKTYQSAEEKKQLADEYFNKKNYAKSIQLAIDAKNTMLNAFNKIFEIKRINEQQQPSKIETLTTSTGEKKLASARSFLKNNWGKMLVGSLICIALVVTGIFTGGVVPIIAAGIATALGVSTTIGAGIGMSAIALGAAGMGAAAGAAASKISTKGGGVFGFLKRHWGENSECHPHASARGNEDKNTLSSDTEKKENPSFHSDDFYNTYAKSERSEFSTH